MIETTTSRYQGIAKRLLEHGIVKWWVHGQTRASSKPPYHSHENYQVWLTEGIECWFLLEHKHYKVVVIDRGDDLYLDQYPRGYIVFALKTLIAK